MNAGAPPRIRQFPFLTRSLRKLLSTEYALISVHQRGVEGCDFGQKEGRQFPGGLLMPAITYAPTHLRVQVHWAEPGAPFALSWVFVRGIVKQQVPPLRCAPVGMTNWGAAAHLGMGGGGWTESTKQELHTYPDCHLRSRSKKLI
jgi:hypothetical protein